ncbi:hypothetical protein [Anaerotignum sp.]|nr:hypothetical protein [Anaerotignum sp.]MBQ7759308.1 hypothetical protein [Anaerotignum sp.]
MNCNYRKVNKLLDRAIAIMGVYVKVVYDDGSEKKTNLLDCLAEPENIKEVVPLSDIPAGYQKAYNALIGLIGALHDDKPEENKGA